MTSNCNCEWAHFFTKRGYRRYRGKENFIDHHSIALYMRINEDYHGCFLPLFPRPTGIIDVWYNLLKRTIIYDEKSGHDRKLRKTELNSILGMIIFYMHTEKAFDLD